VAYCSSVIPLPPESRVVLSRRFGIWMFKIDHSGENLIADDFGRSNIGSRRNQ
jgi:hypothetical protein